MNIKKLILKADSLLLHGRLNKVLTKIDGAHEFLRYGTPHYIERTYTHVGRSIKLRVPTRDLILMQIYSSMRFRVWNLAVHYMLIESLDGKNEYGELFEGMLQKSIYGEDRTEKLKEQIRTIRTSVGKRTKTIEVDRDMRLVDGALQLALALYDGVDFVKVLCCDYTLNDYVYGKDMLSVAGFTKEQLALVEKKVDEILESCRYLNTSILWTPARGMFDELIQDLRDYEPDNILVYDYYDTTMSFEELSGFIKIGYKKDDCITEALRMKSDFMKIASKVDDDVYPVRFVRLKMQNPDYIVKPASGLPYSQESLRCKETLRSIYKHRVENYERDVVIHISDNYLQSNYIWLLAHVDRDITGLFDAWSTAKIDYTLTEFCGHKKDNKYVFAFGPESKTQIIVSPEQLAAALDIAMTFAEKHFSGEWIEVKREDDAVNVYLDGEWIYTIKVLSNVEQ